MPLINLSPANEIRSKFLSSFFSGIYRKSKKRKAERRFKYLSLGFLFCIAF